MLVYVSGSGLAVIVFGVVDDGEAAAVGGGGAVSVDGD